MSTDTIRLGIVGAGRNTRERHIPGFKAIPGVELVSVANRSRESGERVAKEFGISKVYDNWVDLIKADDTNAICIGTWPYLHCTLTLAALEANKHVITEARMAMNAQEAHEMLAAARRKPHLVTQIVPSPLTLKVDRTVRELLADGYLGDILSVEMRSTTDTFADKSSPLHWRHDRDLSGYNILNMGIWYEALMRWLGPATKVMAMTKVSVNRRFDDGGAPRAVTVPDHVDILCDMACGAQAHLAFSVVTGLVPSADVCLFGTEGTLRYEHSTQTLSGGRRGEKALQPMSIPSDKQGKWRVEEEFINAIRGKEKITHTSFDDGVKYMEFTEAVTRSAQTGQAVSLPL